VRTLGDRPGAAFALSLIGGIFVLLGGVLWAALGTFLAFFTDVAFLLYAFLIFGIIIIIGAASMYSSPSSTKAWGIVILILGIISLIGIVTTFGGLLSLIGGALAIGWRPSAEGLPPPRITRICPQCGRVIEENVKFCPHCGKELP
jgi:hypothetical protein